MTTVYTFATVQQSALGVLTDFIKQSPTVQHITDSRQSALRSIMLIGAFSALAVGLGKKTRLYHVFIPTTTSDIPTDMSSGVLGGFT